MTAFPEPAKLDGLFDRTDGIAPRYSYARLNRQDDCRAVAVDGRLIVRFPYAESRIARVKDLWARWDPEAKVWTVEVTGRMVPTIVAFLRDFGFVMEESAVELLRAAWGNGR